MAAGMKGLTLHRIAAVCHGSYTGPEETESVKVTGVVLDSRKVEEGFLFIATRGERVDGHSFLHSAYEKGAVCALGEEPPREADRPYIQVEDSFQALKEIAAFYRKKLDITVVGITGSVGKTSTKELIASVLSEKYCVLKTEGNYNNEVGLPLTVLRLRQEHEIAVLEMGISDFGEMHRLSKIAKPDICVITNIGQCHLENLKSREGILRAKTEIFDYMGKDGTVILSGDDDMLQMVKVVRGKKPLRYGMGRGNDVWVDAIQDQGLFGSTFVVHTPEEEYRVSMPLPGEHMIWNALAGVLAGRSLGLTSEEIQAGIQKVQAVGGRSRILKLKELTLIDDCYNANPVSMKAALDLLCRAKGHKTAILGDMFELGADEIALHEEVGEYAAAKPVDTLIFVGALGKHMYQKAREAIAQSTKTPGQRTVLYYPEKEELIKELKEHPLKQTTVLVKASHGMGFAELVELLKEGD